VKIPKDYAGLTQKIVDSLQINQAQSVKELSTNLKINRVWLAGYLAALENEGIIQSKRIGPAIVHFKKGKLEK
jgi:predicted transcriptional regulator